MKKILIVIDMQNDFLTGSLANWDAERVKSAVLNKINSTDWDSIYFTRDTHSKNYLETSEGKNLPIKHCIEGSIGWSVDNDLMESAEKNCDDVTYVNKTTFGSKKLVELISSYIDYAVNFENIEITLVGVCTGICVVSNALLLKADYTIRENADIICDAECCSCLNPKTHESALDTMECCQIKVINRKKHKA